MVQRNLKQNVEALRRGEYVPKRECRYRKSFIRVARVLSAAGVTSNVELAAHFGVGESTIRDWRKKDPDFAHAIIGGHSEMVANLTDEAVHMALIDKDPQMIRYLLDRRADAFKPKAAMDHTSNGETLSALLAQHGAMSDKEAIDKGLIIDHEAEESESPRRARKHLQD
jgi:hypothetical protein